MDELNAGLVVTYFVGGLVALALTAVLLRPLWLPLWHLFRGTQQFLEDWFGEPGRPAEGVPARPGAMARLAQLERNSGSTMRDAIHRIEEKLGAVQIEVTTATEAAQHAVTAAGLAVNEAKVGRAVAAEHSEHTRANVAELRGVVAGLVDDMAEGHRQRRLKEEAYVAALNEIGIPLLPIADELEGGHR